MKKYVFKPYHAIFPQLFKIEKARIASHIKMNLLIEHVGSTAVPGLGGKGIIDIAIAAPKQAMHEVSKQLQSLGYEYRPTRSTADRFFLKACLSDPEEETRWYHIHLMCSENIEWEHFIQFREYLKNHPKEAQEYAELKMRAAVGAGEDGERYRKGKESIFKKLHMYKDLPGTNTK